MASTVGLRERKKQQTRQQIFEAARGLFEKKGFDRVSVAEIARAADVSEVTVFNYFPTKEDLFYGGMEFFEEQLIESVRSRPKGDSAVKAFRRRLLVGADRLESKPTAEAILKAAQLVSASPSLVARERALVERFTARLAQLLAQETGADPSSAGRLRAPESARRSARCPPRGGVPLAGPPRLRQGRTRPGGLRGQEVGPPLVSSEPP